MTAVEYIQHCGDLLLELDYSTRMAVVLVLFCTILIFSWIQLLLKWSIKKIIMYFKNRGKNNA